MRIRANLGGHPEPIGQAAGPRFPISELPVVLKIGDCAGEDDQSGQAIKAHGSAPTCPAATPGANFGAGIPASSFVAESDTTAINAAAAIKSRRIIRPQIAIV